MCCNESNVATKRRQLIKLLGGRRKQAGAHGNDQTPQRAGASLWMHAADTKGKTFEPSASVLIMKEHLVGTTHQSVDCCQTDRCLHLGRKIKSKRSKMSVYKGHKNCCFAVFFNFWICLNPPLYTQYYYGTVGSKKIYISGLPFASINICLALLLIPSIMLSTEYWQLKEETGAPGVFAKNWNAGYLLTWLAVNTLHAANPVTGNTGDQTTSRATRW